MSRLTVYRLVLIVTLASFAFCSFSQTVTNLHGFYRNGQVFLTWKNINTDAYYKVYRSTNAITESGQLVSCEYLGLTDKYSAEDHNLSRHDGTTEYLRLDSNGVRLTSGTGLFVATTLLNNSYYYAVTSYLNEVENKTIMVGANSLSIAIAEIVRTTMPVFQEQRLQGTKPIDIYTTFFSTKRGTSPILENPSGFIAYDFSLSDVVRDGSLHPLNVLCHGGGLDFLWNMQVVFVDAINLGMEETLPNNESNGWVGDNENYNIYNSNVDNTIPLTGIDYNYMQQVISQTLDWATSHLPVDANRIYFQGGSNGAGGSFMYTITYPEKVAAIEIVVPCFNYGFQNDYNPQCSLNTGGGSRMDGDVEFGKVATNLMSNLSIHFYDATNGGWMIHTYREKDYPVILTLNGKHDKMVGWTEKPIYYDSVKANHIGGYYFWDEREHDGTNGVWDDVNFDLFRYRLNQSFPAFAYCSNDEDYGIGNDVTGEEYGTVNGSLDWNGKNIVDSESEWRITLYVRDLKKMNGQKVIYPDSCTVDVTPRRLQQFHVENGEKLNWTVSHKNKIVQSGSLIYDGGIIVIPKVKVFKDSSVLELSYSSGLTYYYRDKDKDGYGNPKKSVEAETLPAGYVADSTDCDDSNPAIFPGAADICNGIDDNCNGIKDENVITAEVTPSGTISVCSDSSLVLTANSGNGIEYQWYKNKILIKGATTQMYSVKKSGSYYVGESNTFSCTSNSNSVTITIIKNPSATITPLGNLDICLTGSVDLQANAGDGYLYQWKQGSNKIAGATNQVYTAASKGNYKVIVTNSNDCSETSKAEKVTSLCKEEVIANQSVPERLNFYPNPSNGQLTIDIKMNDASSEFAMIEIFNTLNQRVYSAKEAITGATLKKSIDASSSLPDGIYVMKITVSSITLSRQLIIQHGCL